MTYQNSFLAIRRFTAFQSLVAAVLMPGLALMGPATVRANPSGGVVVNGGIEIGENLGGHLQILQSTQKGIINWEDFSISAGELTEFLQPGRDASTLNRVVSGNASAIHGALRANGKLFVINPNGIMVGPGGSIDVAGLVLSTLDVSDGDYLTGGDMIFRGSSGAGVKNFGRINAIGGDVFLMGNTVENTGTITASGAVGLAAGEEVLITANPDANGERVFVKPAGGVGAGTGISNTGGIEGAAVELKAHGNLYALAINNQGSLRATGANRSGGGVYLRAPGGRVENGGNIEATLPGGDGGRILIEGAVVNAGGVIDASATTQQGQGGEVTLLGGEISVTGRVAADGAAGGRVVIGDRDTGSARIENGAQVSADGGSDGGGSVIVQGAEVAILEADISANGLAGGGEVNVGGGFQGGDAEIANAINTRVSEAARISADGLAGGSGGGQVVIWADERTDFAGRISAEARGTGDGGFVEVSGKEELVFGGMVSTLSAGGGRNGTLLLDPSNFSVTAGGAPGTVNGIGDVTLETLLGANHVIIATDAGGVEEGNVTVESGAEVTWNNANALTVLAHGDIMLDASVQNGGAGGVHLIAGWNGSANAPGSSGASAPGSVITAADFTPAEYGIADGRVVIGDGSQGNAIRVGSRGGSTTVAADGLSLNGSTTTASAAAQLGYFVDGGGPVSGGLDLSLKDGGLSLNAGTTGAYAQIGHGGMGATNGATIDAPITITFTTPGAVNVLGGSDLDAYAQIGHGGRAYAANGLGGNIDVAGAGASLVSGGSSGGAYAQIGHGGRGASDGTGVFSGDISFATVNGADLTVQGTQAAGALADGRWAYGQIGHGGGSARGDATGGIDLSIAGGLTVLGGRLIDAVNSRAQNYAQIGHGGWDGDGTHSGDLNVAVNGGDLEIRAGLGRESYAQIGHGGRNENVGANSGGIDVDITAGSLNLIGGNGGGGGEFAYAQLGHGGGSATGDHSGDISVDASNAVTLLQGVRDGAYKLIGHGGHGASGAQSGEIRVNAVNDIRLVGGTNDISFAQIGHGGSNSAGDKSGAVIEVFSSQGAIDVIGGNLGSSSNDGRFAYAQIGMGGYQSDGALDAGIDVRARDGITVRGGSRDHNYALIGNGGDLSDGSKTGEISVVTTTGDILIAAAANHELSAAQIGHGGFRATGTASGGITVETGAGDLTLRNGGGDDNDPSPTFTTGEYSYSYAQIGHGGAQGGNFNRSGDILVQTTGGIVLDAGFAPGVRAYTHLGHGGYDTGGDFSGSIGVTASGAGISLVSGGNEGQYAKVGHGGYNSPGVMGGAITLTAGGGGVSAVAGAGDNAMTQIGHGGVYAAGEKSGDIAINAQAGGVTLSGGSGALALAQIGHGGYHGAGSAVGSVDLTGTGDINVLAGAGQAAYALVGHGGLHATGLHEGDIQVDSGGALTISGGGTPADGVEGTDNFGQIGHSLHGAGAGFGQFVEIDGQVVIEAEAFTTNPSGQWVVVPTFADPTPGPGPFLNARGEVYLQLPDGSGVGSPAGSSGKEITYEVQIDTPGTYRLYPRWTGHDGGSDSVFIDVVELKDGTGGTVPDWYEFQEGGFSNFNSPAWSTTGGFEANNAGASPRQPALLEILTPGTYTIRVNAREDGLGFDAIALLPEAAATPTGLGPAPTYAQRSGALGAVTVDAVGNIAVSGGINSGSHGAIGHGGSLIDNLAGRVSYGSAVSAADITVRSSGGDILLTGGANSADSGLPTGRYAAIGHHGSQSDFDAFGDVVVEGGNVTLTGGANDASGARIGHGGDEVSRFNLNDSEGPATFSGAVEVMAANSIALLGGEALAGGTTGGGAQLGHGGIYGGAALVEIDGDICVVAGDGVILNANTGAAVGGYTQIGHGGVNIVGGKSGKIAVTSGASGAGGVALTGGSVADAYAQIGHGGVGSSGDMSGDLSVVADNGGAISLTGGAGADSYAMTGHGDGGGVTTTGTRQGGVRMFADGGLIATDGGSANTSVFHQTNGGLAAVDYLGGNGFQLLANGGTSFSDGSLTGVNTMANGNFGSGPVSFAFANDFDISIEAGKDQAVDTSDHRYLITGGSIELLSSYQNAGDGDAILVAGWDGTGSFSGGSVSFVGGDFCDPVIAAPDATLDFNNCDIFGNNASTVTLGGAAQTSRVAFGSRAGATRVAGHGLLMEASNTTSSAFTHLGFVANGTQSTGDIGVHLKQGGLTMASGDAVGAYTQIGHGGRLGADAAVDSVIAITFCDPGDVLLAAAASSSYAQIGHGGEDYDATLAGDISLTGAGAVDVLGGVGTNSLAKIGHGGNLASGDKSGEITVTTADGDVTLRGGSNGSNALAQIGHGGRTGSGTASGNISVSAGGADADVSVLGGTGNEALAMLGHGGTQDTGNKGLDGELIAVSATGDVNVIAGPENNTLAQIGNGGLASSGTKLGDISVTAGGDVYVTGGQVGGDDAYAMIGSGGAQTSNTIRGDITVEAGGLVQLRAGTNPTPGSASVDTPNFAQIGHGGHENRGTLGTAGNAIEVSADIVELIGGSGAQSYAQIGMGGYDAGGSLTGDICVHADTAVILNANATAGDDAYVMIGNGGTLSGSGASNYSGDIVVTAGNGGVTLRGGDGAATGQYAQIGHGGINSGGAMSGEIFIGANDGGNVIMTAGSGTNAYAMGGHGDGVGTVGVPDSGTSGGTRQGGIQYFADGDLVLTNGLGGNTYLHHRTNNAGGLDGAGNYLGGEGYQLVVNGNTTLPPNALEGLGAMVNGNVGFGDIVIVNNANTNLVLDGPGFAVDNDFNFIVISGGDITMRQSYQNAGTGDVILVAGWDGIYDSPATLDLTVACEPVIQPALIDFNNCDRFGNNDGMVVIGDGAQTSTISVGTRQGTTRALGHGLELNASDTTSGAGSQLGYRGTGSAISGDLDIRVQAGGVTLNAGATDATAQIGHGGFGATASTISDTANIAISFCEPGEVALNSGDAAGASTQIGHGGRLVGGAKAGDIVIGGAAGPSPAGDVSLNAGSQADAYAQIGHGGRGGSGSTRGGVRIESVGTVAVNGGSNLDAYAQIGHGGHENRATHGDAADQIVVIADTGISLVAGTTTGSTTYGAYAQIGNGGYDADGNLAGDIHLNHDPLTGLASGGGDITLDGGDGVLGTNAQVGHGGRNLTGTKSGDIWLGNAGALSVTGGSSSNYAQIGHGGNDSSSSDNNGNTSGSIRVLNADSVEVQGGGTDSYAQIGHGGYQVIGNHGASGDVISVNSTGDILVQGGSTRAHAQIGNGGRNSDGDLAGLIEVVAGGDLSVLAGTGADNYAQIGHGGALTEGSVADSLITIDSIGTLLLAANQAGANSAYSQIGHGGFNTMNLAVTDSDIRVNTALGSGTGDLTLTSGATGTNSYTQLGHGGARSDGNADFSVKSGDITIGQAANVTLTGGANTDNYAQIGHGGEGGNAAGTTATFTGMILLNASGDVSLNSGTSNDTYTQIGHGGDNSQGDTGGDIEVNAGGSVALNGGSSGQDAYAQIGHGGHANGGNHGADGERISVNAATGSVSLSAGAGTDNYAQIGNAGNAANGSVIGTDIAVNARGAISLQTGGTQAYAQIGHGGFNTMNLEVTDADISINTAANTGTGNLSLLGSAGVNAYAQIGHGGSRTDGNADFVVKNGDITVGQAADIILSSGSDTDNYTQIGHGGEGGNSLGTLADFAGEISLNASGDVSLAGGSGVDAYAQIGHGGDNAVSNTRGSIDVMAGGAVSLAGGAGNLDAYAQIGHGGHGNDAVHGAADEHIAVTGRTGGVSLLGGATTDNYAQIGHGGNGTTSTLEGDIFVNIDPATLLPTTISGDVSLEGGATRAYAQIGHGGYAGAGQITGLVAAFAGGQASLTGGASADAYAQIGHGGRSYQGDLGDDTDGIVVAAQSGVILESGVGDRAYTQIGHGGHEAEGDLQAGVFVNFDPINGIDIGGGPISLNGGGLEAYAQIGHGGYAVDGTKSGDVVVTGTGDADLVGGDAEHAYVQIGHGGVDTVGNTIGDITLAVGGHLDLFGGDGEGAFAHIGHGGDRTRGGLSGDLMVSTGDGVTFTGGTAPGAHAQMGHGGREHRGFGEGGITVVATTGDISLAGGDAGGYVLLGHGGESIIGYAMEGDVSATAEGGSVLLTGGGDDAFAQIGHGGRSVGGPKRGRVEVAASDDVSLIAGDGSEAYAQIGLGGSDSDGAELGGVDDATVVVAGGDVTLRASDTGQAASAMIGHGGVSTGALSNQGSVLVEAGGDVGITGGAANFAMAQIGNGGLGAGGTIRGDVLVQAENVAVNRGTGLHAYGKIGNGDHYLDSPVGHVGDSGSVGGDIQLLARRDITLQGGMIGGLDPTLDHRSAPAAGDTFLAVSRNDPTATGTGNLIGDTDSVLAAGLGGELRLYLPTRANNQLASGVNLNGTDYPGANVDPMNQQIDELVIHQIDEDGVEVLTPDEHRNLINGELNFIAGIVSPETANYSDVLGDYSLYYDTITVVEAGPPVIPVDPGDGGAGGSAGGGGETGGGALPGPGGGEESTPPEVVIVTGPDGTRQVVELTLNPDGSLPMFITLPDGTVGFAPGRLGVGSPFVPVGFVLESFLDDRLLDDQHETLVIYRDPRHPWENGADTDFTIEYQPSGLPGWSSFNVFGDPLSTGAAFTPTTAGSDLNPSLRAYLEGLEIQSAELRTGAE